MSLLQVIIYTTGFIFVLFAVDLFQRKKFNFLHFLVFFGGTAVIVLFTANPSYLDIFGNFFGVARGADLIVYISIIFLAYFYFELLHKNTKTNAEISKLTANLAIDQAVPKVTKEIFKNDGNDNSEFVFLIRAYNEEQVIGNVIREIFDAGYSHIVIVDDGSKDETKEVIMQLQTEFEGRNLLYIKHPINRGGGAANKTLFSFVKKYHSYLPNWCVTYDADGQMEIADMKLFKRHIKENPNSTVFLGSRFAGTGQSINMPLMRKVILIGSRVISYFFSGIRVNDTTNGYKVIHKDIVQKMHLESDGFGYAQELLSEIQRLKAKYVEVGVTIKYTDYSLSKGQKNSNAWKILKELVYKGLFFK